MNQAQKIQNPETKVPKTPQMNERDFINDQLTTEKYMTSSYNIALNEASNQNLYQDLATIFKETQDCQRNLYNLMFKNGWYALEQEEKQKMDQTYQQFTGYKTQLPYTVQ
ncbi:Coat F domain-containing protein [Halobacillus karajensis]|uniref:Spore coat protein n=1 Tax=Halobacillus karajensis TaxID=195088 RepID=A0A059NYH2_9BACI|nr:spore coat protein [Halobacillus karajensis]CDQ19315.1 Spore coat protein [Halobacillus karajensis]CDQ22522.1 Spore coat protein [Halobacillus karajensis]CDQ26004.1 Spore coat protein [Halobacillus karajensis]SEH38425.1 Coat F domain-containing protein [Halobacillus karajensis]